MRSMVMLIGFFVPMVANASIQCKPWQHALGDPNGKATVDLTAEVCLILPQSSPRNLRGTAVETTAGAALVLHKGEKRFPLVKWLGSMAITDSGEGVLKGSVLAAGQEVWKARWGVGRYETSKQFELLNIEQKYTRTVMVGVIPAQVDVGVRSRGTIQFKAGAGIQTAFITALPTIDAELFADGGIGSEIVFVGVEGTVEALKERLILGATMEVVPREEEKVALRVEYKGSNVVSALSGKIMGVLKTPDALGRNEMELYSWNGYTFNKDIFHGVWMKDL
jgi:hypothetical protein